MKRESLQILGLKVSRDFSVEELLLTSDKELITISAVKKIKALREFYEEFCNIPSAEKIQIKCSDDVTKLMAPKMRYLDHEEVQVLLLNRRNIVLGLEKITSGTLSACNFDCAQIAKQAIIYNACGVLLVHNHPSGDPSPSIDDMKQTEQLHDALKLLNINLVDHIIISEDKYYSFSDLKMKPYK